MKSLFLLFAAGFLILLGTGCAHEKYGKFTVQAINTAAGVSAGMSQNGELLVLSKDDQRQAIYVSGSRTGQVEIFSCQEAPLFFVKVHFFGKKNTSILRVELPAKTEDLKFYRYREVGNGITLNGKKVWIMDLKEVSPDGRELRVAYEVQDQHGRKTGTYYPETNTLTVR